MKIVSVLSIFVLAGLFLVSFSDYLQAGGHPGKSSCLQECRSICEHAVDSTIDCSGQTGPEGRDCRAVYRILNKCCFTDCAGDNCDAVLEESVVCEAIEIFYEDECLL